MAVTVAGLSAAAMNASYFLSNTLDYGAGSTLTGSDNASLPDTVDGTFGNDTLKGGYGADSLNGDQDNDQLYGDSGNDHLFGYTGLDTVYGGDGNDYIEGEADADQLRGDKGNDTIYGGAGEGKRPLMMPARVPDGIAAGKAFSISSSKTSPSFASLDQIRRLPTAPALASRTSVSLPYDRVAAMRLA